MIKYFSDLYTGGKSLLTGLGVTFKAFIQPTVTVQYPREKINVTPNIRGHLELLEKGNTGESACITCGKCARECPSGCIELAGAKKEGAKGKVLTMYRFNYTKCSLCGNCVETCPVDAIGFSNEYELASCNKEDFHFDLLKRMKDRSQASAQVIGFPEGKDHTKETLPRQAEVN